MNIASYDELFDQSECPILIFTSGNYTTSLYSLLLSTGIGNIYKPNAVEDSSDFNEENITELLLSVEATVFFNKKFNITSVKQKD